MLNAFSVENYRAFARQQHIEIRPLTLFFGWNSGGKSALVRFLPLLAESLRVNGPPIWLAGDVGRHMTWPELVCKFNQRGNLGFTLQWEDKVPLTATWEIAGDLEGRWQEARSLKINQELLDEAERIGISGLCPKIGNNSQDRHLLSTLRNELNNLASQVQWINGVRARPPRIAMYGGGVSPMLHSNGNDAVNHLIAAQLRSSADPLLEVTKSFFSALGEQLVLDNPMDGAWRVLLHPVGAPQVRVNLCDTGEGYAQVLPVLVALARSLNGGPNILCLEQPELHLHTKAQAELSKLLISAAKGPTDPRILVETHSEILLTSIQLAIASGEIEPQAVRVYWVESHTDGTSDAIPVDFNQQGQPTNTALMGAFYEAVSLGQELIRIQMADYTQRLSA